MRRKVERPKLCASIAAGSLEAMARKAARALALGSDLVELRIDTLEDAPSASAAIRSLGKFAPVAVVTVRSGREGGRFSASEGERLTLISRLAAMNPAYLDVELATVTENREWLRSLPKEVGRIVSWHDFHGTPGMARLRAICRRELERGEIAKVVTTARRMEDNLRTLRLCEERRGGVVAFCMGELGSVSRLVSMEMGAPLVYAALPNETVAPGQLSIPTMLELRGLMARR